jgi:hypothetical protein
MSQRPLEALLTDVINNLNRRFLGAPKDVTFTLRQPNNSQQQVEEAKSLQISLYSGQKTLNTVQAELGQPLYEMPEADEPFIVAGNQVIFLRGMMNTDAAGETTEQVGTVGAEQPEQPEPEVAAEVKAFRAFTAKRLRTRQTWRDFDFKAVDADTAASLNAEAREQVEAKRRPLVDRSAISQGRAY